jgi:hypothetical protein
MVYKATSAVNYIVLLEGKPTRFHMSRLLPYSTVTLKWPPLRGQNIFDGKGRAKYVLIVQKMAKTDKLTSYPHKNIRNLYFLSTINQKMVY